VILAIDSSMGTSVAVVNPEGVVLSSHTSDDPRAHAELIGVLIERSLATAQVNPVDITAVVMGVGPGAFTGLRVGMAAAEAFALSRDLPVYPVVSHDALGWFATEDTVVVTDARRGEVAYSVYLQNETMKRVVGPALSTPDGLDQALGEFSGLVRVDGNSLDAGVLARVALEFLERSVDLPTRSPLYLRVPDVTVKP
jgi:tRNA threonylcarbamoyladenosine biosynthesis protein TsaB